MKHPACPHCQQGCVAKTLGGTRAASRLMNRWSCSMRLLSYFTCLSSHAAGTAPAASNAVSALGYAAFLSMMITRGVVVCAAVNALEKNRLAACVSRVGLSRNSSVFLHPATAAARLAGWLPPICQHHPAAIPGRLVEQLPLELGGAYVGYRLRQMMMLQHPHHMQVFHDNHLLGFRKMRCDLMQRVLALIGDLPVECGKVTRRFAPVLAAFFFSAFSSRCSSIAPGRLPVAL